MISFSPMWAIVMRHIRVLVRDPNVLLYLYWPILDILVWGYLGSWIQQSHAEGFHNYEVAALLGILLWQVIGRGSNSIIATFSEELWANNIVNLFSLPLRTAEWIGGVIIFYAIMTLITALTCIGIIYLFYEVPIGYIISTFLIFLPPLFFCGIWLGFTALQIIAFLGKRGVELGYVICWFLLPFSGAYYPIEVLPSWAQKLSALLPMSYITQGMREYVMHQKSPFSYLVKGYCLSILYAVTALILFVYCFNRSRQKGLARLTD